MFIKKLAPYNVCTLKIHCFQSFEFFFLAMTSRFTPRQAQYQNKGRVMIMAEYPKEKTTDVPEHAYLKDDPNTDWDERARGLGGTLHLPLSSVGEENVLCLNGDRYYNQDILVHEFGHGIHHVSAEYVDPSFTSRLQSAYNTAMSRGLWANTYAATNYIEYFAIGVQLGCSRP